MNEKPHSPRTRSRALRGAGAHQLPDCLTACCYEIEPGSAMDACRRTWAPKTADNFHCHACRSIGPSSEANISAIRCQSSRSPSIQWQTTSKILKKMGLRSKAQIGTSPWIQPNGINLSLAKQVLSQSRTGNSRISSSEKRTENTCRAKARFQPE